jgi:transposase-like protein
LISKEIEDNTNKRKKQVTNGWSLDETYIKVSGKERFFYRAVDKHGNTIDFLLTKRRMKGSDQKFLNKAIRNNGKPIILNIDKSTSNTNLNFKCRHKSIYIMMIPCYGFNSFRFHLIDHHVQPLF